MASLSVVRQVCLHLGWSTLMCANTDLLACDVVSLCFEHVPRMNLITVIKFVTDSAYCVSVCVRVSMRQTVRMCVCV